MFRRGGRWIRPSYLSCFASDSGADARRKSRARPCARCLTRWMLAVARGLSFAPVVSNKARLPKPSQLSHEWDWLVDSSSMGSLTVAVSSLRGLGPAAAHLRCNSTCDSSVHPMQALQCTPRQSLKTQANLRQVNTPTGTAATALARSREPTLAGSPLMCRQNRCVRWSRSSGRKRIEDCESFDLRNNNPLRLACTQQKRRP